MSGFFGVVSQSDCSQTLFYGTDYHSHLGTEYGGLAVLGETFSRTIHNISQTQFKSKFFDDHKMMKGNKGIGVISAKEEQPIFINSKFGPFCIVSTGRLENANHLAKELLKKGISFSEVSRDTVNITELVAKLITQGNDLLDGIQKMFKKIDGSCSFLILNHEGVWAIRDRLGYTPIAVGQREDAWAVTSETSAFTNNGFATVKYMAPGEIVLLNEKGMVQKKKGHHKNQICSFLWIYTGFPSSSYEGINVETVRERCGQCLAKKDRDIEVDVVCGVPDSGIAHALGYAMESKRPYRRPLVKYTPGYGRSYTPPAQDIRDLVAKMKLVPIKDIIEGKRIVVCDDSIVRGTQLKNFTIKKLWENGAREVHVRIACPPLMFPCRFNLSTRTTHELAARRAIKDIEKKDIENVGDYIDPDSDKYKKMVKWIEKDLEVTTLRYQRVDDMVKAIGLTRENLCLYCWTGKSSKVSF
ncbi:MAG: amidophosphoribosyltransferase [Spirochaetes bacterium]|nr:amidophosphoribosyltransferase [Spirochaetota bacterium]